MKVIVLLALLLLYVQVTASAQVLWQQTTGTAAYDEASVAFLPVPEGYLNIGQGGRDGMGSQSDQIYVSKLDAAGKVLWQKGQPFFAFRALYPNGAAADAQGQFYVAANGYNPSTPLYPQFGMLVKYSAAGDTIWTRRISQIGALSSFGEVVVTNDGGIVVIGDRGLDSFIEKYSVNGDLLWHRNYYYSSSHPGYLQKLAKLPNGFLVVDSPDYGSLPPKYLVLDNEGLLIAEKPAPAFYPYSLKPDLVGNLLSAAGRLTKISPQGDSLWTRSYQLYGRPFEVRVTTPLANKNYLLGGTIYDGLVRNLALLLVDQNGNRLRDTLFVRPGSDVYPTGLTLDAQNNYVVGGYTSNGPIGRLDQFAFAVRQADRYLASRPASLAGGGYTAYPNPVAGELVRVAGPNGRAFAGDYELLSGTGQRVRSGYLPAAGLNLIELPPGLYLLRLREPAGPWQPPLRLQRQ